MMHFNEMTLETYERIQMAISLSHRFHQAADKVNKQGNGYWLLSALTCISKMQRTKK